MGGGLTADAAKSRARGVGVGERGDRSEGGGDGESTAIKEDGNVTVSMGSRALGLEARTSPPEGAGRREGAGVDAQWRRCGAIAFFFFFEFGVYCPLLLATRHHSTTTTNYHQ